VYRNSNIILTFIGLLLAASQISVMPEAKCVNAVSGEPNEISTSCLTDNRVSNVRSRIVRMEVTAYCPCSRCCGKWADGVTASGHKIQRGDKFVAADIKFPFGTMMIVPGYAEGKKVKVLDRGGAITGNKIDVFFSDHKIALVWGRKDIDVEIFE